MAESLLNTETTGIGSLIQNRRYFKVPDHQREYAWTEDEASQYLDDVMML